MAVSAATQIFGGFLADRIPLFWLGVGGQVFYAIGISSILFLPTGWLIPGYTLLVGLAQGLFRGLYNTVWVRYFGREHLGKIRGLVAAAGVAGSSVGPFLLGITYDSFGDFNIALIGSAVIMLILGVACFWATPPEPQGQS
jgi:MFS family permease